MKRVAVYPGSFNPWHAGHQDILTKALAVFDKVVVARGINPNKPTHPLAHSDLTGALHKDLLNSGRVEVKGFGGLLVDFLKKVGAHAVIRGLRNGHDLQYEMNQQYWNEDLGIEVPTIYFICDRTTAHLSSSMLRALNKFNNSEIA